MTIDDGIIGITDVWADWMWNLGTLWQFMNDTEVYEGVNLFSFLLGSGILVVISFSITKWILDFIS